MACCHEEAGSDQLSNELEFINSTHGNRAYCVNVSIDSSLTWIEWYEGPAGLKQAASVKTKPSFFIKKLSHWVISHPVQVVGAAIIGIVGIYIAFIQTEVMNRQVEIELATRRAQLLSILFDENLDCILLRDRNQGKHSCPPNSSSRAREEALTAFYTLERVTQCKGLSHGECQFPVNFARIRLDLSNLSRLDLRHSNFTLANLTEANLIETDLRNVNFNREVLSKSYLTREDLRGANLILADLREADLDGADLRGVDLTTTQICEQQPAAEALSENPFKQRAFNFNGIKLQGAQLTSLQLKCIEGHNGDINGTIEYKNSKL